MHKRQLPLALALGLFAAPAGAQQVGASLRELAETPVVIIRASDTIGAPPDTATIHAGVQTEAMTAAAALSDNSLKMEKLMAAVRAAGVPATKVQTTGIRLNARYDYQQGRGRQQRIFRGYEVSNSVRVTTGDIAGLGPLLDKLAAAGGTNISGPYFSIANPDAIRAQARRNALAEADQQAAAYARERGFARARLIVVNETGASSGNEIVVTGSRASAPPAPPPPPPPVAPGEVGTGITLTVQYILER